MTNQEWKRRCIERIYRAVQMVRRVSIRDLERATNYNRGPAEEGIPLWFDALEYLEQKKAVVVEKDEFDNALFVAMPAK